MRVRDLLIVLWSMAGVVFAAWQLWLWSGTVLRIVAVGIAAGVLGLVILWRWRSDRLWRQLGYRTLPWGRDEWAYEERDENGAARRLLLDGERLVGGKSIVYLPSPEEWERSVPEWARGRRAEIVGRVGTDLERAGRVWAK